MLTLHSKRMFCRSFPKAGAVPMIIACDDSEAWSAERVAFDWKKFLEVK